MARGRGQNLFESALRRLRPGAGKGKGKANSISSTIVATPGSARPRTLIQLTPLDKVKLANISTITIRNLVADEGVLERARQARERLNIGSDMIDYLRDVNSYRLYRGGEPHVDEITGEVWREPLPRPDTLLGEWIGVDPYEYSVAQTDLAESLNRCQVKINSQSCYNWVDNDERICHVHQQLQSNPGHYLSVEKTAEDTFDITCECGDVTTCKLSPQGTVEELIATADNELLHKQVKPRDLNPKEIFFNQQYKTIAQEFIDHMVEKYDPVYTVSGIKGEFSLADDTSLADSFVAHTYPDLMAD